MGLDDRDYMRDRHRRRAGLETLLKDVDRPFEPPRQRAWLLPVFTWLAVAFVLYKVYGWWFEQRPKRVNHVATMQARADSSARTGVAHSAAAPQSTREPVQPVITPVPRSVQPALEPSQSRTGGTIYLCRDYGGGSFWSSSHCHEHKALVDRMDSVPEGIPFEQQVQLAEQRRNAIARATAVPQVASVPAADPAGSRKSQCDSLNARVEHLDALARQPHSAQMQDWIRSERHKARDEQFRLRC